MARLRKKQAPKTDAPQESVEAQLSALQHDVSRLHEQIHRMHRLATLGTSAAMVAHEINNLMTPILGYARFALSRNDSELTEKALRTAVEQTEKVIEMSDRALEMACDRPAAAQSNRVSDIVDQSVRCLCRDPSKDGIRLDVRIDPKVVVWGDAGQLSQVFLNLLLNARSALADRTGRIRIEAEATDDRTTVRVSDDGCGIAPEHMDAIFDAFFTTANGSNGTERSGTGLGLAICHGIIERHRGTIGVESQPGVGTTFTISLPTHA